MSKLMEDIARLDLPDRNKLMMTMFPGLLFGFVPPNFKQLEERLSCQTCLTIANKLKQITSMRMPSGLKYKLPWVRKSLQQQVNANAQQILSEIKTIENKDKNHWEGDEAREISREFMTSFVGREGWERYGG